MFGLITLIESILMVLLTPLAFLVYFLYWRPMERRALDPANCAAYLNTEHGTRYTAAEIDAAYRQALVYLRDKDWIDRIERELQSK